MEILVTAQNLKKTFGARPLFKGLNFSIARDEHVGLIGPNGAGKSTLLRLIAGRDEPDEGEISYKRGLRIGYLEQVPQFAADATVGSAVAESNPDPHDWEFQALIHEWYSKLSLDGTEGVDSETPLANLSGGWKKRVALARELVRHPDLLLLDEPTNHLDVESILWLENLLAKADFASLTITHDRLFLQRISSRILELDSKLPEGILSVSGDYADYLENKAALLHQQAQREAVVKNILRRETEWLRRGPKARGTKQQARIKRAGEYAEELDDLRSRSGGREARIEFVADGARTKKLITAHGISKTLGGRTLFSGLDLLIGPKSRIGLLGPNGCGKSTLIKVLLGEESSDTGSIERAEALKATYFEQNRETLDPKVTLAKTICPAGDHVIYQGNSVHFRAYLDRFLFTQIQMEMPVGRLSGGEQSRLLLARLMLQTGNVLVLDEPTNDLDIATLDILRDCLSDFGGGVLLVSHDRFFMNEIASQILAFGPKGTEAEGKIEKFASLDQWESWHEGLEKIDPSAVAAAAQPAQDSGKKKLGYLEQREFDGMEAKIHAAEAKLAELQRALADPANASNAARLQELSDAIGTASREIDAFYARWSELSGRI